jgi:ASPM-SPD-2-Hydin domain-containing protein/beta-propeller repeat-containing protein
MESSHPLARAFRTRRFMPQLLLSVILVSLVPGFVATACAEQDSKHTPAQTTPSKAALKTEGLPIAFEPNLKQADARYKFLAHQNGLAMGFLDHSIEVRLATKDGSSDVLGINFEGAQSSSASAENLLQGRVNYLRGSDPAAFQRNVPTYARVRYASLYPGTDLIFYGNGSRLEHDFVLAPGADPRAIALRFTGMRQVQLTPSGDLLIQTAQGAIEFHRPFAYQETSKGKVEVSVAYHVRNDRATFDVGSYNRSLPLIIDPVLDYSTFLGDAAISTAHIATDSAGNTYITSLVFDPTYPTTPGSLQPICASCSGQPDVVITKLSADGSGQVYSTFLGGTNYDEPFGIAVDSNGNAIVVGRTQSTDFPVKNPASTPSVGFADFSAFVSSLSADGSALNYSTLLGSGVEVLATAVAVDSAGNAYVTGDTSDATYPVTPGALHAIQNNTTGGGDPLVFLSKFLPTGTLSYSALVGDAEPQGGGAGPEGGAAVAVDLSGNAYIYGRAGTLWPITPGVFQPAITAPSTEATFVTKVAPDGASLVYSTFVGSGFQSIAITLDSAGDAILTGADPDSTYPVTPDARVGTLPQFVNSGWLTKLNATGTALVYSSFITAGEVSPSAMTLDGSGNIWIVGSTSDVQFPLVHPLLSIIPASSSFTNSTGFIMEFDATGKQLLFSTYFGGATEFAVVQAVAADTVGQVHVAGIANNTLHTTPGSFHPIATLPKGQTTASFGFAAKIDPNADAPALCLPSGFSFGLSFDSTQVGQSTTIPVVLTNCGTAPLSLSSAVLSNPLFTIDTTQCASLVAPNGTCSLPITFTPVAATTTNASLTLTTNTPLPVTTLQVSGSGVVPVISIFGDSLSFDPVLVGQAAPAHQLFIQNNGGAPLQIDLAHTVITGADFSFTLPNCTAPLNLGGFVCVLTINFTPQATGTRTGTLTVASNDPAHPQFVLNLSGVGVASYPVPTLTSMSQSTAAVGSSNPSLLLSGANFFPTSVVSIAGQPQKTTYQGATSLSVAVDPAVLSAMSELPVTVVNPVPGGGESAPLTLTVYQKLDIDPSFVVSVLSRGLLYASIPASATANPNTVIPINPATGAMQAPIAVGNDPRALAVSDDGSFLFVAAQGDQVIQRINLSTGLVDRTFPYPTNSLVLVRPFSATMLTVPGSQKSLLVYFASTNSLGGVMELFNDAGLVNSVPDLTQFFEGVDVTSFAFTDAGTAYSLPFPFNTAFFNVFTIDAGGLHLAPVTGTNVGGNNTTGSSLASDGKLLYTTSGQVWDPVARTQVGSFPVGATNPTGFLNLQDIAMDTAAGQFFAVGFQTNGAVALVAYDVKSLTSTGTLNFTELSDPEPHNLVRWGSTGFGFISTGATFSDRALYLLRSGLSKNQAAPAVTLTGSIADFGSLDVGVSSAAQSLTLTNSGSAPLNIRSITTTRDFTVTNTCAASVAPNASCTVLIAFKPTAAGARTGLLTIVDDAISGEAVIALSGTATTPTLTIAPASGATNTATVTAGQTATYNLSIAATPGAAGTVMLACNGVPTNATCSISPSSLNLSSGANATFTVTVNTQVVRTASLTSDGVKLASIGFAFLAPVALLFTTRRRVSYRVRACVLLFTCLPAIALIGCGGGGASTPPPSAPQAFTTPPGTYNLTVSATNGAVTTSQSLTLIVH